MPYGHLFFVNSHLNRNFERACRKSICVEIEKEMTTIDLGRRGEEEALRFLESKGMKLLDRNWRSGYREIDLVMEGEDGLHIVEVRSLTESGNIPYESIDRRKQRMVMSAAARYVYEKRIHAEVRFDVVSVVFGKGDAVYIEYFADAFAPQW